MTNSMSPTLRWTISACLAAAALTGCDHGADPADAADLALTGGKSTP